MMDFLADYWYIWLIVIAISMLITLFTEIQTESNKDPSELPAEVLAKNSHMVITRAIMGVLQWVAGIALFLAMTEWATRGVMYLYLMY